MSNPNIWTYKRKGINKKIDNFQHYPFDHLLRSIFSEKYDPIKKFFIKNSKNQSKNLKVLDIGTFKTHNAAPFFIRGFNIFGSCVNKDDLSHSKKYAKKNKIKISLKISNNRKLKYKSNFFDIVMAINTLQYEESKINIEKAIDEIKRVTKKNGLIFFDIAARDYSFVKKLKRLKKNIFVNKDKSDFRYGNKFFFFENKLDLKKTFQKKFEIFNISRITQKFPMVTTDFYHISCINSGS